MRAYGLVAEMKRLRIGLAILASAVELTVWGAATPGQSLPKPTQTPAHMQPTVPSTASPAAPLNRTRTKGSSEQSTACPAAKELVALSPTENPVLTTAEHPTFLFYVPYSSEQVQSGEFLVVDGSSGAQLYQIQFKLPEKPGIVSLSLPNLPELALKEDTAYHWYFKLYCGGNSSGNAASIDNAAGNADTINITGNTGTNWSDGNFDYSFDGSSSNSASNTNDISYAPANTLEVDGWVQRVALTPERQLQLAADSPDLWYDSLAQVAAGLVENPQNSILRAQWRMLLQHIKAEDLVQEPLIGTVQEI